MKLGEETIICIDDNAHSPLWYSNDEDDKGRTMAYFIQNNNLEILNKRFRQSTHKSGTNIDLTLSNSKTAQLLQSWSVFPEDNISDQNMIYFKIKLKKDFQTNVLDKFSTKRVNYELINQTNTEQVNAFWALPDETHENEEDLVQSYQNAFKISCDRNLPKVNIRDKYNPWWNNELTRARTEMARLGRKHQACYQCRAKLVYLGQCRRQRLEYRHLIREDKKTSWRRFMEKASPLQACHTNWLLIS